MNGLNCNKENKTFCSWSLHDDHYTCKGDSHKDLVKILQKAHTIITEMPGFLGTIFWAKNVCFLSLNKT